MHVACTLAMFVFLIFKLFTFFYFFQISALDRTSTFYINPNKCDNLYIGKANGFSCLWAKTVSSMANSGYFRNNRNRLSEESKFVSTFDTKLPFLLFYLSLKMHKYNIFNNKRPHYLCLCEIWENLYHCHESEGGYLSEMQMTLHMTDALDR